MPCGKIGGGGITVESLHQKALGNNKERIRNLMFIPFISDYAIFLSESDLIG